MNRISMVGSMKPETYWYIRHVDEGPVNSIAGGGYETRDVSDLVADMAWRQINFTSLRIARDYRETLCALRTKDFARKFRIVRVTRRRKCSPYPSSPRSS